MGQRHFPETKEELNKLVEDLNINLGDIDTCLITNMSWLFSSTERTDFSGIESWDTSNVTNMACMFYKAKHFNENINAWNVSKVKDMSCMFADATHFNQNISSWNVSKVENMSYMFSYAENFNQPLDKWDTSSVELMRGMFGGSPLQNNPPKWYKP